MSAGSKKYKSYAKPPITEAVIEARFVDGLSNDQLEKLIAKQKGKFTAQKIEEFEFKISNTQGTDANAETSRALVGYKLIDNNDSSNIILIKHHAISISRLPPYQGWPVLIAAFEKYFDTYTNKKFKQTSRIGVRYINRIDIPSPEGKIELEDYFKIHPNFPKKFPDIHRFAVNAVLPIDNNRMLTISLHSAPDSPLLDHLSVVLDLDVAQFTNLPSSSSKLYELLGTIRDIKDTLFEDLLTAKCKKLFK